MWWVTSRDGKYQNEADTLHAVSVFGVVWCYAPSLHHDPVRHRLVKIA